MTNAFKTLYKVSRVHARTMWSCQISLFAHGFSAFDYTSEPHGSKHVCNISGHARRMEASCGSTGVWGQRSSRVP